MKVEIRDTNFDPWHEARLYQKQYLNQQGKYGATTVFIGTMRDMNEGDKVSSILLEHYPEMTQKHLEKIAQQALDKFEILDVLILHRIGKVFPNDAMVCVVVWSAHRAAAYEANRLIMEDLKSKAPFWKKESLEEQDRWVEKNTPGQV